nr:calcineurin-like phosphoesterase C-terminal domain-containing protein [uncultured Carboxylicivirga sp.]
MKHFILLFAFFIGITNLELKAIDKKAKGFVYNDINLNQVKDKNEKGIEGVLVSNGVDIVKTNKHGEYEISISSGDVIFVVKPNGWKFPLNDNNLPQFYYLYKPNGSPSNYNYKGILPTGELPDEINFALCQSDDEEQFKVLLLGDTQPYSIEQVDFFAEDIAVELIGRTDINFGMTMGDIVGDDLNLFYPLNQAIAQIGIPWYNVMGNHDVNYMAPDDIQADDTFNRVYGPSTYAFVYGKVHFIVLDDILHHPEVGSTKYDGGLRADQLEFVSNYLKNVSQDDLIVLNMHIPFAQNDSSFRPDDQSKLFELLKDFPKTLSISGHSHLMNNYFFESSSSDWKQETPHHHFNVGAACGSWWSGLRNEKDVPHSMMRDGTPNGYAIITFNATDYTIDWKVAGSPHDHKMNIYVPRGVKANSKDTTLLTVNFFNGSEQSEIEYRIKGQTDWIKMNKTETYDPYYEKIAQRWVNFKKIKLDEAWLSDSTLTIHDFPGAPLIGPVKSTHIWQANIGNCIQSGRYVIEVKVRDRYGRTFKQYHTMRVD